MILKIRFFILLFVFANAISAQIPTGYYNNAAGLTGTPLRSALHNIIKNHTSLSYSNLENQMKYSDVKPGNVVWDIYSDIPGGTPPYIYHYVAADQCGNYSNEGDCWNKEHSWPQSWFNSSSPMVSDLFHIYPTDGKVNGVRSNYPYGTVSNPSTTSQNGSKLGPCTFPGYSGTVFEPLGEYKGDLARSYFYMCTRYYTEDSSWDVNDMVNKADLKPWALELMKQWNHNDPVSQKETDRNNVIYGYQHNRNPFIDHPEWVTSIWGNITEIEENIRSTFSVSVFPNPATSKIEIQISDTKSKSFSIEIFDVFGKTVISENYSAELNSVDISKIPHGIYCVKISDSKGNLIVRKLMIEN